MKRSKLRDAALSRWDNEGGAPEAALPQDNFCDDSPARSPALGDSELVQLRIRVIALERLLITLLSEASGPQLDLAREMASYISPRPGRTQHPMTLHAAAQMRHLVGRANRIRGMALC